MSQSILYSFDLAWRFIQKISFQFFLFSFYTISLDLDLVKSQSTET